MTITQKIVPIKENLSERSADFMKVAIITVAGISSRFNVGFEIPQLKAIYFEEDVRNTLLFHLLKKCSFADCIIIVGGYKFDALKNYIDKNVITDLKEKITLIYNEFFQRYSSGYSLFLGLKKAFEIDATEIVFAEGDLDVDTKSFLSVAHSDKDVLTCTSTPIYSDKSVVFYKNDKNKYRYSFNREHGLLRIEEPFSCIFNSGQIWKFHDMELLQIANNQFYEMERDDTNLGIIRRYFENMNANNIELIFFKHWVNCNTRKDYQIAKNFWREETK